jgi:hypothetical protein
MKNLRSLQNFNDLLAQLEIEKILFNQVENEPVVRIPTRLGAQDGILYIYWEPIPGVIQLIQILPFTIPKDRRKTMTTLLNRINFNIPVLGFALNEKTGVLTYRTQAFLNENNSILPGMIGALMNITIQIAAKFLPQLKEVITPEAETRPKSLFEI